MARLKTEVSGLLCWNCGHHYDEYNFTRCLDCGAFASDNPAFDLTEEEEFNDTNDYDDIDDPRDDEDSFEDGSIANSVTHTYIIGIDPYR